jgi:hypothetical protein
VQVVVAVTLILQVVAVVADLLHLEHRIEVVY